MKEFEPRDSGRWWKYFVLATAPLGILLAVVGGDRATGQIPGDPPSTPLNPSDRKGVELAPYMGELQRLTHKLSLSVKSGNNALASFYLYESLQILEDIKTEVPQYRGLPIALLIDQLSTRHYEALKQALKEDEDEAGAKPSRIPAALAAVVASCNQCHVATKHGFIKITDRGDFNPFNQEFTP